MDASKLVDDALAKVSYLGTVGAMKWLAAAIAPPVAAGSVDTPAFQCLAELWRYAPAGSREFMAAWDGQVAHIDAWGARRESRSRPGGSAAPGGDVFDLHEHGRRGCLVWQGQCCRSPREGTGSRPSSHAGGMQAPTDLTRCRDGLAAHKGEEA